MKSLFETIEVERKVMGEIYERVEEVIKLGQFSAFIVISQRFP